ncbi:MAG: hypothetical protein K9M11_00845 [Candidatus Pacebacteria bacterium]|nr:hypothetical protein [Candidatus Paceibacterota bacterium]
MKQATNTIKMIDRVSETIFWSLAIGIALLSAFYMYSIQKSVRNVVTRSNIQADIVALNSKLSETEFQYMNSVGTITLETAQKLGYVSAINKTFVTRERIGQNVAIR